MIDYLIKNNKSNTAIMNCTTLVIVIQRIQNTFCFTDLEFVKDVENVYGDYINTNDYNLLSTYSF